MKIKIKFKYMIKSQNEKMFDSLYKINFYI